MEETIEMSRHDLREVACLGGRLGRLLVGQNDRGSVTEQLSCT